MPKTKASSKSTKTKRVRKPLWKRKRLWVTLVVLLVPGGGMVVLTRTDALSGVVLSGISDAVGGDASASSVRMTWGGRVVIEDLTIDAPGVQEAAGRVLSASQLVAEVDWSSTLGGSPRVKDLKIIRPLVRISVNSETGTLNLAALKGSSGTGGELQIPSFTIVDGTIETGEHTSTLYSPLRGSTLRVDGSGGQVPGSPDVYRYAFTELNSTGGPAPDPTKVTGTLNLEAGTVFAELVGLDLSEWSRRTLPSAYQPLWEQLQLRGRVPRARFSHAPATGPEFGVDVDVVTMRVPVDLREAVGKQLVELDDVSGTLGFSGAGFDADIEGVFEGLPVELTLHADRLTPDTPARLLLSVEGYTLASQPTWLPWVPEMVDRIYERFGMPEGEVVLELSVSRGEPIAEDVPAVPRYKGSMVIAGGRAAYDEFPYPIHDISARFEFDNEEVRIVKFEGTGATGGTLSATGHIRPPGDGAEVLVDIAVRDVALDDEFREAMPASRRPIVDVLFDRRAYEKLREQGLIRSSADPVSAAMLFDLAGTADLDIRVFRPLGDDSRYSTTIDVHIADAGLVPEGFGYPVIGRDIDLEITPRLATIRGGTLEGLTGMTGTITGEVAFPKGGDASPDLLIEARSMPIDRTLALALPDNGLAGSGSPRDALIDLGMTGVVNGRARVMRTQDERLNFEVLATLDNVASASGETLRLEGVTGDLRITRDDFEAMGLSGRIGGSPFAGGVRVVFARPLYGVESSIRGDFDAEDIELSAPFEDLASRFDDDAGSALVRLREKLAPEGRVDASLLFEAISSNQLNYTLHLAPKSDLSIRFDDERWEAHQPQGELTVTPGFARFDEFSAALGIADGERFSTLLSGVLPIGEGEGVLEMRTSAMHLDSATARTLLRKRFSGAQTALDTLGIHDAIFDLEATLRMTGGKTDGDWSITPSAVDLLRAGVNTETAATGSVQGTGGAVLIPDLTLDAETWTLHLQGGRDAEGAGSFGLSLETRALNDSLYSLVPPRVSQALRGMELTLAGAFALDNATLTLSPDAPIRLTGDLRYDGLSARIGAPIGGARGTGRVTASEETFDLTLAMDEVTIARIGVTDATLRAVRHGPGKDLLIPTLRGDVHGGLLFGRGVVRTSRLPVTYEMSAELASVRFAGVLGDLDVAGQGTETDRGLLDAGFLLYGRLDRVHERRGRATMRVQGGRVLDLPGIIPLLELSNLQAPANERVDLAYADLFIGGGTAIVDRLTLFSDSLRIAGTGDVDLGTLGVDLAFSTYGARYVPILSPLLEGLREEIASTRVTGTLNKPVFRTEQLRSTRALLDAITGPEPASARPPQREPEPPAGRP